MKFKKLNLKNSNKFFSKAKRYHPGGVLGIRRPYNFVEGEYPIYFKEAKGVKVILNIKEFSGSISESL